MVATFDAIVIVGPTASGKSALALQLAAHVRGEIVSCDSVQVYRGFDIGSAKPTVAEQAGVPHHLIDVVSWRDPMDAGRYARLAAEVVPQIAKRGKIRIIVGGTGLYLRALLADRWHGELPKDPELRNRLDALSNLELLSELAKLDPARAAELHRNDRVRLLRALELATLLGKDWQCRTQKTPGLLRRPKIIYLAPERAALHQRIEQRVSSMLRDGLIDEVRGLQSEGCPRAARPMQAIGYRQVGDFLAGEISAAELPAKISAATRQYAKRQDTWFGKLNVACRLSSAAITPEQLRDLGADVGV